MGTLRGLPPALELEAIPNEDCPTFTTVLAILPDDTEVSLFPPDVLTPEAAAYDGIFKSDG